MAVAVPVVALPLTYADTRESDHDALRRTGRSGDPQLPNIFGAQTMIIFRGLCRIMVQSMVPAVSYVVGLADRRCC
jgi:hypothetical protein